LLVVELAASDAYVTNAETVGERVRRLALLNELAYPDLLVEGVVFDEAQFAAHLAIHPAGLVSLAKRNGSRAWRRAAASGTTTRSPIA
jgi:hypothetical protein